MRAFVYGLTIAGHGIYVGATVGRPRKRLLEHLSALRGHRHYSRLLQAAFDESGESAIRFQVLEVVLSSASLTDREQFHIDIRAGRLLNATCHADPVAAAHSKVRGRRMPEDERAARSASAKKAIAEGRSVRGPWSAERKAAHSVRLTGRKMPPVSDATKAKLRNAALRREASKRQRDDE